MGASALTVMDLLSRLSKTSRRPRYAFMVLNLLAEQANDNGKAGPFILEGGDRQPLRHWIGHRMARLSDHGKQRRELEARVRADLAGKLPQDLIDAQAIVDQAVEERIVRIGADNFSRVAGELEKAGYLRRHYEGYITNHKNRGGRRNLAVVLDRDALAALRRRDYLV